MEKWLWLWHKTPYFIYPWILPWVFCYLWEDAMNDTLFKIYIFYFFLKRVSNPKYCWCFVNPSCDVMHCNRFIWFFWKYLHLLKKRLYRNLIHNLGWCVGILGGNCNTTTSYKPSLQVPNLWNNPLHMNNHMGDWLSEFAGCWWTRYFSPNATVHYIGKTWSILGLANVMDAKSLANTRPLDIHYLVCCGCKDNVNIFKFAVVTKVGTK